ncbi:rod shape-determining protein MreC [Fonticella tunisiensis]|uniref:Cell shape-determining protein MreC n=1 Tax=Fonticella tunisiensis TaxID=1096341 RepID=A0A4V3ETD6_9CLOT|nr:rod shape-determining protein MreC [Fonticella tunisiensis]TDT61197.1 rod shape-determining protein MreC [Fonticella tunisiensis]
MNFLKNKLLTIVLVLCLAFTIFIGVTANARKNTGAVPGVVTSIIAPIQKYIYAAGQRIGNIFHFVSSVSTAYSENIRLKSEVKSLQQKLVEYDTYKRQNEELNKLLGFKNQRNDLKFVGANVIGKSGENWFDILIIDVGKADGVAEGQYVVTNDGLVGKIIETTYNTSKVMTILDERINVPARLSSAGEDGIVTGMQSNNNYIRAAKMNYLPVDSKAQQGDIAITSNIIKDDSVFIPAGIIIGTVQSLVNEKPNLEKAAILKPAVDFSSVEKVFVITR